jgi:biotin transport system substrate-specific component
VNTRQDVQNALTPNRKDRKPKAISPTPLRDWIAKQSRPRRAGMVALMAALIACGGKAGIATSLSPVPFTHQLLFVLVAGALLGSRLGCLASFAYLIAASVTDALWPMGAGPSALTGPLAGYLWSLPVVAYLSGAFVERERMESWPHFAVGICAAIAAYDVAGAARLLMTADLGPVEIAARGSALYAGPRMAQGALAVLIAWTASSRIKAQADD